jgi:tRNA threonylcarbamoyladenosine biosynthesis protein TsaE
MRESLVVQSKDAAATAALGARFGRILAGAAADAAIVIFLNGELGAGKTTFVGGLLHELGVKGPVRSPTYTLIEPYELGAQVFYHLDLYRLQDPRELEPLGVRDLLVAGSVLLIEWAERGGTQLPIPDITLHFHYQAVDGRDVVVSPSTKSGTQLAIALRSSTAHE